MLKVFAPLALTGLLICIALIGVQIGLAAVFAIWIPYAAALVFFGGLVFRVVSWASSPVPFRIPTTCGQQRSLSWIKHAKLDNPSTAAGVIGRLALEILVFRSLFRNTQSELLKDGRLVQGSRKFLWVGALAFHAAFLVIVLRHLRFFSEPPPFWISWLQEADGFFQVGLPVLYLSSFVFVAALSYLLLRRLSSPQLRYISLANDYFPLFLLLGIGLSGICLRYFARTDVVGAKELALGLAGFAPHVLQELSLMFYCHLFLVCVLLACFPFGKLAHMAGVFLSPTRNLANNNRAVRHINPWNYPVKVHTYEEYEEEFRKKMKTAGIPVEKS